MADVWDNKSKVVINYEERVKALEQELQTLREALIEVSMQIAQSTIEDPVMAGNDFFYLAEPIQKRIGKLAEAALEKGSK